MRKPGGLRHLLHLTLCILAFACTPTAIATISPTAYGTDSELETAIEQARGTLADFIAKITTPRADQTIVALKVRFYPPDELPQDIWVDGITYTDGDFRGDMGDDIPKLKLEFGEKIKLDNEDIVDWMIVEDGKLIGGYTIRLAVQRMSPEERGRFLESLDYAIED